jgi:hypothetical protein
MNSRPQQPVLAALRTLLRPVVRLVLRHGVTHRDVAELVKELFVEVATEDFGLQGRPTNVSRTALLTGLDRKEVRRIRATLAAPVADADTYGRQDRLSRVLSGWYQDPDFSDAGIPRRLPLMAASGPSFTSLAQRYGGDVPATTLLKELKRSGAVADEGGELEARKRYYMPATADTEALVRAGSVIADLGNTVVHNLAPTQKAPPRFEGRATNRLIATSAIGEFRTLLERRGQSFLEEVDAWLTAHETAGADQVETKRLGVGLYWIEGPADG